MLSLQGLSLNQNGGRDLSRDLSELRTFLRTGLFGSEYGQLSLSVD
jgi:hypothetical protein